jgi:type I restriction-modification system DNA methylase subunit
LSSSIETLRSDLEKLIRKFRADKDYYLSGDYLEAQTRVDFITPFFKALGWDVENEAGLAHHQREVIVERGESETTGRPDYNFRIGGQTKFFVEAKAPSEALSNPHHVLQAKGYVWNTRQVFFVILTDFEEFRFYDASRQPDERNPDEGLLLDLKYADYLSSLEKLWEFSKERVAAGSLDALLPKARRAPHLRRQVDDVFLDEMTGWREDLAKDIHKRNPALTAKQLNEVVQRLLDRIVFIRIAEDRHVIEKRQLAEVVEEWQTHGGKFPIFDWLNDLFHKINEDFNGEIFKPHLSEEIQIDSEILARIIKRLYPPQSPYRFDVIGVELLGSIYERYLGNTIRLTPKQVRVEEKPEVRKAGGVYYTPKYIVDYIVKNTVGKVIEGKTPKQIEKIRILDPACGSGSFLIGAFQYLIDYHAQWYLEHPEQEVRHAHPSLDFMREVHTDPDGSKRLSVYRKAKILRQNIFGVDIDPQAVEITMMSLYLKALEGEQSQLPPKQHLLPELKYNIQCANSLIGPDIYDQGVLFAEDERDRINAFDWNFVPVGAHRDAPQRGGGSRTAPTTLPSIGQVMRSGGFDCVIGNPPYIRSQSLGDAQRRYYGHTYKAATGTYDIYVLFVERALSLINKSARIGYILPNKFYTTDYGAGMRNLLTEPNCVDRIVDFEDGQVFGGAGTYTNLLFLSRHGGGAPQYVRLGKVYKAEGAAGLARALTADDMEFEPLHLKPGEGRWTLAVGESGDLLTRLQSAYPSLSTLSPHIFQGLKTSADKVYMVRIKGVQGDLCEVETGTGVTVLIERSILRPVVKGEHVQRYWVDLAENIQIIYPYKISADGRAHILGQDVLEGDFPHAWAYFKSNDKTLRARDRGMWSQRADWYAYARSQNIGTFVGEKLLLPYMTTRLRVAPDVDGKLFFVNITTGGYGLRVQYGEHHRNYLVGLLNSRLLDLAIRQMTNSFRGGYFAVNKQGIERLPFRPIDFSDPADRARHDKMVELVDRMLELNKQKHSGKLAPSQVDRIDREIASTDAEIDDLVYELYGIADEERRIVESTL